MKKILALLIAVFCLSSVTAFATAPVRTQVAEDVTGEQPLWEEGTITVDNSFNELYYNNQRFVSFNSQSLTHSGYDDLKCTVTLSEAQKETVEYIDLEISFERNIINADYRFKNGSKLSVSYLSEAYIDEYNSIMKNDWESCEIDFIWPESNKIYTIKSNLLAESEILFAKNVSNTFDVYAVTQDKSIKVVKGQLLTVGDEYYYLDFSDAGINYSDDFYIGNYSSFSVYKITDEDLCDDIEDALEEYYGDDYGFLEDDKFTSAVSDVLLVIVFGIIPFGLFLLFFILALRSKTVYKKLFRVIYISALVTLIIFISLALML